MDEEDQMIDLGKLGVWSRRTLISLSDNNPSIIYNPSHPFTVRYIEERAMRLMNDCTKGIDKLRNKRFRIPLENRLTGRITHKFLKQNEHVMEDYNEQISKLWSRREDIGKNLVVMLKIVNSISHKERRRIKGGGR